MKEELNKLQGLIFTYRQKISADKLQDFDEHFGIEVKRHGEIELPKHEILSDEAFINNYIDSSLPNAVKSPTTWVNEELDKNRDLLHTHIENYVMFGDIGYNIIKNQWEKKSVTYQGEELNFKKDNLIPCELLEGSLALSPIVSKEENIEMFNNWIKEKYND